MLDYFKGFTMNETKNDEMKKFQKAGQVKVIQGSILAPHNAGLRFVLSIANTAGKMENPLFPLFEKKWKKVREEVRGWWATKTGAYKLGAILNTATQSDVWVISMLCQNDDLQTDTVALEKCLKEICKLAKYERATIHVSTVLTNHMPELSELLQKNIVEQGLSVYYYEELDK